MKKMSKFTAVLLAVVLCMTLSVPAFADSLNPTINVEKTQTVITVTVEDSSVIRSNIPTLAIPADASFDGAKVFYTGDAGNVAASTQYKDGKVYFKVPQGGTYHIVAKSALVGTDGNTYTFNGKQYTEVPRVLTCDTEVGLSFKDEIYMTVDVTLSGFESTVGAEDVGVLSWTGSNEYSEDAFVYGNENVTAYLGAIETETEASYIARTADIPAKELGDEHHLRVYVDLGGMYMYGPVIENCSPQKWALEQLTSESANDELKAALVALLDYGAAAQTYFNYKADDLVNATVAGTRTEYSGTMLNNVVGAQTSLVGDWKRDKVNCPTIIGSLILNGMITNNFRVMFSEAIMAEKKTATFKFWSAADYEEMVKNNITFAESKPTLTFTSEVGSDGYYMGGYPRTAAKDLGDTLYLCVEVTTEDGTTYRSGIIAYSVHAYVKDRIANSQSDAMKNLVKAMTVYGEAAEAYFEAP